MIGVRTHAIASHLGIDRGTARLGMLIFFEHQHTGTLAKHKTVAILVPRAARSLRIVIAR